MKFKKRIQTIIILIILFIISTNTNIYATEIEKEENSKKYEEWLELDENEKKNTIAPLPINIRTNSSINNSLRILKSTTIPTSYDLRDYIDIKVKDQESTGLCWGFSANTVLETYLALNKKTYDFSERHIEYNTAKNYTEGTNQEALNRNIGDGGYSTTAFTYYSRGSGPILEEDMPFENNENSIEIEDLPTNVAVQKVDDMIYFSNIYKRIEDEEIIYEDASENSYTTEEVTEIRNQVKKHIMENGAVSVAINYTSSYYNSTTHAYNYNANGYSNHAVTIIGWDDTYSKDNFSSKCKPTNDGAYIVLNSWGKNWGEDGIFYVSYEDFLIESSMRAVSSVSDIEYDSLYQHDTSEMYGVINSQYAANVFTSEEDETLTEIMIGTWSKQTCNIYINTSGDDLNINNLIQIASNVTLEPGYNTIEITDDISLIGGKKFSIVVELSNSNGGIGIECEDIGFANVESNLGESYFSKNGTDWKDLYDTYYSEYGNMNFCIKAYTQTKEKNIKFGEIKGTVKEGVGGTIGLPISITYEKSGENFEVKIIKDGEDVTSKFTTSGNIIRGNGAYITIDCPSDIEKGEYIIQATLSGIDTAKKTVNFIGEQIDISKCTTTEVSDETYTGNNVTKNITVTYENTSLNEGTDYTITYLDNINTGKATINIRGKGNYKGAVTKYFYILPTQVTEPKVTSQTTDSITMSWSKVNGEVTGYEIYSYNYSNGKWECVGETTSTSYTVSGLTGGTNYKYRVIAYKTVNNTKYFGSYSNSVEAITKPKQVTELKVTNQTTDSITMSWPKVDGGVTGYEIYSYNYSNGKWESVGKTASTSYTINKLTAGTIYKYRIRAYRTVNNVQYFGSYAASIETTTKPKQVSGIKVTSQTTDSITINWSKVDGGLTGYKIYVYNYSNGEWKYAGETTGLSYTINNLTAGTIYEYRVVAYKTVNGTQYYGSYETGVKTTTRPKKVTGFKVKSQTTNTIKMTWSKVDGGVTGYKIYAYNYSNKKWEYVGKTKNTSYTIKKLKAGTIYKYRIRAYRTVNNVQYFGSYTASVKTSTKPSKPKITSLKSNIIKRATIKWNKVSGASGYQIYMATSKNGKYKKIATKSASKTSYTKTKLTKNKRYYFKIRAYKIVNGKKIYSSYSSVKSVKISGSKVLTKLFGE